MIIAVDGPTASGKGTIAKALAEHFGLPVLDTGLLYRAVGYQTQLNHGDPDKAADALVACDFPDALLDDPALRYESTGSLASRASVHPAVRKALFQRQVDFANQPGGAVLDGRDIGTVVCPQADAKIYVTARPQVRAWRRFIERQAQSEAATFDAVLADIERRDARDAGRESAPMRPAPDADLLETSDLDIEAAFEAAVGLIKRKIGR